MAYPTYPTGPAPGGSRPSTVTIAGMLLYAVAALLVVNGILSLVTMSAVSDTIQDVASGDEAEALRSVFVGVMVVIGVINLIVAAGFVVLALFNTKGKNASRVVTWVIGGLGVCCCSSSLISGTASSALNFGGGASTAEQERITRRMEEEMPAWLNFTSLAVTGLIVLCLLAALILLALPASNEYFRRPSGAAWDPSAAGPQYGGQYPPAGGSAYPPAGYDPYGQPSAPPSGPPAYGQPSGPPAYGQPSGPPAYGQPSGPPAYGQPSGPPAYGPPQPGQPQPGQPAGPPAHGQPQPPQPGQSPPGQSPPGHSQNLSETWSAPPASDPFAAPLPPAVDPYAPPAADPFGPPPQQDPDRPNDRDRPNNPPPPPPA